MKSLSIIAAVATGNVAGSGGGMPWHCPDDLKHFKKLTEGSAVIMGRRTWDSLGRPLPNRLNIVLTKSSITGVHTASSLEGAIALAGSRDVFVIGGEAPWAEALLIANSLHLTCIDADYDGDVHFPAINPAHWAETGERRIVGDVDGAPTQIRFIRYSRV